MVQRQSGEPVRTNAMRLILARALPVVGLLLAGACTPGGSPAAPKAQAVEEPVAPPEIFLRSMRGGTEIEVYGELKPGTADAVERLVQANPQVRTIHLNSPGGLVREGLWLREVIFRHGLDTYTSHACSSACTYAYLGGREQYLRRGARLGFHATSEENQSAAELKPFDDWRVEDAIAWGVDPAFAAKAYLTPNDTIWYPTTQELLDAGVVTKLAEGQFAVSGYGPDPSRERLAQTLKSGGLLGSIAQARPAAFDQMVDIMLAGLTGEQSDGMMSRALWGAYSAAAGDLALHASDESLLALARVQQEQTALLRGIKTAVCQTLLPSGSGSSAPFLALIPRELRDRELDAMAKVLASGAGARRQPVPQQRADAIYIEINQKIAQKHGQALASLVNHAGGAGDRQQICKVVDAIYLEILALPPAEGAALMRYRLTNYLTPTAA